MTYKSKVQIGVIVAIILLLDVSAFIAGNQQKMIADYEARIEQLEGQLQIEVAGREEDSALYRTKLLEIIDEVYGRDMIAMGGADTTEAQTVEIMYEAIMNSTLDYRELLSNVDNYFAARDDHLATVPNVWPVEYSALTTITSPYGYRLSPITGRIAFHGGLDIAVGWNAPIYATADGEVIENWPAPDGYWKGHDAFGGLVKIRHANGFETWYAHLSRVTVTTGTIVQQGDLIGYMGDTGQSRGQHLHYEVFLNGERVNPLHYLRF